VIPLEDDLNAHTLTVLFHRLLSEREWQAVAAIMRTVPYAVEIRMNAVHESPEQLVTDGWNPLELRAPRDGGGA
jgi:hypothetical protein